MGNLLNTSSMLMCPHGGTVTAITSSTRVTAGGSAVVRASDTFLIFGCAFVLGLEPHPCVQVQWVLPDALSRAEGDSTLSENSLGFCVAADQAVQGAVVIVATQPLVAGT